MPFSPVGGTLHSLRPVNVAQLPSILARHKDTMKTGGGGGEGGGRGHLNLDCKIGPQ